MRSNVEEFIAKLQDRLGKKFVTAYRREFPSTDECWRGARGDENNRSPVSDIIESVREYDLHVTVWYHARA